MNPGVCVFVKIFIAAQSCTNFCMWKLYNTCGNLLTTRTAGPKPFSMCILVL